MALQILQDLLAGTGARLLTSLVHEMERREAATGLVSMCIGVGQGIAAVLHNEVDI